MFFLVIGPRIPPVNISNHRIVFLICSTTPLPSSLWFDHKKIQFLVCVSTKDDCGVFKTVKMLNNCLNNKKIICLTLNPKPPKYNIMSVCRVNLYIYLSIYIYISIYVSMYVSIYLSKYLHKYLFIYLSKYLNIYLSIYLSTYLPIYISIYLSRAVDYLIPEIYTRRVDTFKVAVQEVREHVKKS